jgi:hypothetical protein
MYQRAGYRFLKPGPVVRAIPAAVKAEITAHQFFIEQLSGAMIRETFLVE